MLIRLNKQFNTIHVNNPYFELYDFTITILALILHIFIYFWPGWHTIRVHIYICMLHLYAQGAIKQLINLLRLSNLRPRPLVFDVDDIMQLVRPSVCACVCARAPKRRRKPCYALSTNRMCISIIPYNYKTVITVINSNFAPNAGVVGI